MVQAPCNAATRLSLPAVFLSLLVQDKKTRFSLASN
jgi:hypothetical protein